MKEHNWTEVAPRTLTNDAEYDYVSGQTEIEVEHGGLTYTCQTVVLGSDAGEPCVEEMIEWQIDGEDVEDEQIPRTVREIAEEKALDEAREAT